VIEGPVAGGGAARADSAAWLAVAAGTIGALMATLDISIVNASLPTIQGEIGASSTEGTWVSTAYLVAEIVMIPLAGWLERILGLRKFLLIATGLFVLFSIWCGLSQTLPQMIVGRVGQGFTGGAMIPTALTIVATRLPPRQQPGGIALFGMTAVMGPVLGPVIGGWLTENVSWHYAFFLNLPIGVALMALILIGLPPHRINGSELRNTDVLGLLGLMLGLGALTVVLEEGQRDRWFESELIRWLTAVSLLGFTLLLLGQVTARTPIIRLSILRGRNFCGAFLMNLMMGAALYGILYIIPQFLSAVAGYNSEQSGLIAAISGIPTVLMLGAFPVLVRIIDVRLAVALGIGLYSASCFLDAHLNPDFAGPQFFLTQVMRGFAQFFSMLFLNQAATSSVPSELAADASGLFNAARNLGGSFGLAAIAILQDRRTTLHMERLSETITANSFAGRHIVGHAGLEQLSNTLMGQATVMTYADLNWVFAVALVAMLPLVFALQPLPKDVHVSSGH
jgi:DHA2 family multidrug resistance protein